MWTPQASEDVERIAAKATFGRVDSRFAMHFLHSLRLHAPLAGPFRKLGLRAPFAQAWERIVFAQIGEEVWIAWIGPPAPAPLPSAIGG